MASITFPEIYVWAPPSRKKKMRICIIRNVIMGFFLCNMDEINIDKINCIKVNSSGVTIQQMYFLIIAILTTIIQKYATDQETLKELKKEQKLLQEEMKKYKDHPEKLMELQKKQLEFIPKTMKLSMRAIVYTGVPFILLFRWFMDFFNTIPDFRFFGFLSWFWFYLIFTIILSSILRKIFKVV